MKKTLYTFLVLLVLVTSCKKNDKEPFEKAIVEVYGSNVECVPLESEVMYSYHYVLDFNDENRMINSFLSLSEKVDSIMKHDYKSCSSLHNYTLFKASWFMEEYDPMTCMDWSTDDKDWRISVDVSIDMDAYKKGKYSVSLSFTKLSKKYRMMKNN